MYRNFSVLVFAILVEVSFSANGQGTGNSPFSQFGVGELFSDLGNSRNIGMGNAGVSNRHHHFINYLNPALLSNLRTPKKLRLNHKYLSYDHFINQRIDSTVKIDFGLTYQSITSQTSNAFDNSHGMNLAYLAFSFPLSRTWGTSIGIRPFSTVNYNLNYTTPVIGKPDVTSTNVTNGRGGIYKMFWANGFGISKNLSVGLETAYLFGNINQEITSSISDFGSSSFGFKKQNIYSAYNLKPGMVFRREIIKSHRDTILVADSSGLKTIAKGTKMTESSGVFYNFGFTYDYYSPLNVTRNVDLFILDYTSNLTTKDTTIESRSATSKLPPSFKLGFSIDKPMKWSVSADVFYAGWSVYRSTFNTDSLVDSYGINIGAEYTLGQLNFRSKTIRAGFSYVKTPIYINGKQLEDVSVSIGGTIPFGRTSNISRILPKVNVALVAGQRGDVTSIGLREQYLKVFFSILINEKWFNKRKIY